MVHTHHYHIFLGKTHAGVPCRGAGVETAAMEPHHHWFVGLHIGSPHVEHAALLRHLRLAQFPAVGALHGLRTPHTTVTNALPGLHATRRHETLHTGIRDA